MVTNTVRESQQPLCVCPHLYCAVCLFLPVMCCVARGVAPPNRWSLTAPCAWSCGAPTCAVGPLPVLCELTCGVSIGGVLVMAPGAGGSLLGGVIGDNGAPIRVGVEQQQRLEVAFNALSHHVLPPGAHLTRHTQKQSGY